MQESLEGDLPIKVEGRVLACMVVKPAIVHQGQVLALVSDCSREAVIHAELSRADKRLPIKVRLLALHKGHVLAMATDASEWLCCAVKSPKLTALVGLSARRTPYHSGTLPFPVSYTHLTLPTKA